MLLFNVSGMTIKMYASLFETHQGNANATNQQPTNELESGRQIVEVQSVFNLTDLSPPQIKGRPKPKWLWENDQVQVGI